jgi:hypothetical protein
MGQTETVQPSRLVQYMDEAAAELAADPDETYEVAVGIADSADDCRAEVALGAAAADIRDTFGTWAQLIHTYGHVNGSTLEEAEAAHRDIEAAVSDWARGGRDNPAAFGRRWRRTIKRVDITWLNEGVARNVRD